MPRIKDLRLRLDWSQSRLAIYLGLSQDAVSLMERGQPESGPASRLIDLLASAIADGRVTAGMDPAAAFAALGGGSPATGGPSPTPSSAPPGHLLPRAGEGSVESEAAE